MTILANTSTPTSLFDSLAYELDRDAYERLAENSPGIANALGQAVAAGATAEQVRAFLIVHLPGAEQKTRWLQAAARYLEKVTSCC
jgi:hypothetical protein